MIRARWNLLVGFRIFTDRIDNPNDKQIVCEPFYGSASYIIVFSIKYRTELKRD